MQNLRNPPSGMCPADMEMLNSTGWGPPPPETYYARTHQEDYSGFYGCPGFSDALQCVQGFPPNTDYSFHSLYDYPTPAHFWPSGEGPSHAAAGDYTVETISGSDAADGSLIKWPSFPNPESGFGVQDDKPNRFNGANGRKRKRNNGREAEKQREVVHVRARRGQATDSHSLAERIRREKINEKLRCLQDLVPGCYKTMGMAVMLDVISKYILSLQNQIEFLSMKLSAASLFYDFNSSEMEAVEKLQGTNGNEAQVMMGSRLVGESQGYGGFPHFQSGWPPH